MIDASLLEALLLQYAAGTLPAPESLIVAAHLALNPAARKKVSAYEHIGGDVLENETPEELCHTCLDNVLQKITHQRPSHENPIVDITPPPIDGMPAAVARLLYDFCACLDPQWSRVNPGVERQGWEITSCRQTRQNLYLMRIAPHQTVPKHAHSGTEISLVLEGDYQDQFGYYKKGDISIIQGTASFHAPAAGPKGCLCLILVSQSPQLPVAFQRLWLRLQNLILRSF